MTRSSTSLLLFFLLSSSLIAFSSGQTITEAAAGILWHSGYKTMSIALHRASNSIVSNSTAITVFAPDDSAFFNSGEPTLNLTLYHIFPSRLLLRSLKFGTKIATLLDGQSLIVTSRPANRRASVNNVILSLIHDDGSLKIFGIKRVFDFSFGIKNLGSVATPKDSEIETAAYYAFSEACKVLKSKRCSVMASFLETQIQGFEYPYPTTVTVFAPIDQFLAKPSGNESEHQWIDILHRHLVPRRLSWTELNGLEEGTELNSFFTGFKITVSRNDTVLFLNGISVMMPDMFLNDWLVVHGITELLELPERPIPNQSQEQPPMNATGTDKQTNQPRAPTLQEAPVEMPDWYRTVLKDLKQYSIMTGISALSTTISAGLLALLTHYLTEEDKQKKMVDDVGQKKMVDELLECAKVQSHTIQTLVDRGGSQVSTVGNDQVDLIRVKFV